MRYSQLVTLAILFALPAAAAPSGFSSQTGPLQITATPGSSAGIAPFMRTGDPFFFPATITPTQYTVVQPPKTTSYRLVNACTVDIRIKSVTDVNSTVTATTGTRFLARMIETVASTPNPQGVSAPTRIISIMTMSDPGPAGCVIELQYGNGG